MLQTSHRAMFDSSSEHGSHLTAIISRYPPKLTVQGNNNQSSTQEALRDSGDPEIHRSGGSLALQTRQLLVVTPQIWKVI